jgi:hypothetical protein
VVECAVKQVIEPLFEATFWQVSYGFRPGRGCHGALEHIRRATCSRKAAKGKRHTFPCPWVIEGDVKGCFDNLSHHQIMERIHHRCADRKVNRLILLFLKAGVLAEDRFIRTDAGSPQGGNLSPLLANVALGVIEEKYERWVHQRESKGDGKKAAMQARAVDRKAGRPVFFPIRYADDFVVLVSGSFEDALREKEALAEYLKETRSLNSRKRKPTLRRLKRGLSSWGTGSVWYGTTGMALVLALKSQRKRYWIFATGLSSGPHERTLRGRLRNFSGSLIRSCGAGPTSTGFAQGRRPSFRALIGMWGTDSGGGCRKSIRRQVPG